MTDPKRAMVSAALGPLTFIAFSAFVIAPTKHVPPACGGPDTPDNMQWQTIVAAHAKDRWERNCALWRD